MKGQILLNTVSKVKEFISIAVEFDGDIDVIKGKYLLDGKSIMGLFSLDLSEPLTIKLVGDDTEAAAFLDKVQAAFPVE